MENFNWPSHGIHVAFIPFVFHSGWMYVDSCILCLELLKPLLIYVRKGVKILLHISNMRNAKFAWWYWKYVAKAGVALLAYICQP